MPSSTRAAWAALALCATLAACQGAPHAAATQSPAGRPSTQPAAQPVTAKALQREWMLVALPGFTREQIVQHQAAMDLRQWPRMSAHMGCNQIGGKGVLEPGGKLTFREGFSTLMACEDMRLEDAFNRLLPGMTRVQLQGQRMTLRNAAGQQMEFVAADWD